VFVLGTAYYPDYLPDEVLAKTPDGQTRRITWQNRISEDFKRMRTCGISAVRMGEFSWSTVEPQPGRINFARFRYALDHASVNDIKVIFCTPTATPPKWLVDKYPDILPITREGRKIPFGSRRHYDFCHPMYLAESRRITSAFAQDVGNHPAVIGWQIDNEFGCHGSAYSFTEHARVAFRKWLLDRYKADIEALNRDWFTAFWSQRYNTFEQIELPLASWADQNPHMELDFRRFSTDKVAAFQHDQVEILRRLSPNRFITHNFMTLFSDVCAWRLSEELDIVGFDHYQMETEPHPTSSHWQFALMRSLKRQLFFVLEQQPLQVNWQATNRRYAYDWLFLWGIQAALLGSAAMYYFSWQRFPGGAEQYHDAILPHDIRVSESWQERVLKAKRQLFDLLAQQFGVTLAEPMTVEDDVLCIYDFESVWSHDIAAQSAEYSTRRQVDFVAALCQSSGLGLSFARTISDAAEILPHYKCLVLPGYAFEFTAEERQLLQQFVNAGGSVISLPRTGMKKRNNQMSEQPLTIFDANDFYFEDFGALLSDEKEPFKAGAQTFEGTTWAEKIKIVNENWKPLAQFTSGLYRGFPAVIQNASFANQGRYTHLCACPPSDVAFISWLIATTGLLPRVKTNKNLHVYPVQAGQHRMLAALNFTDVEQELQALGQNAVRKFTTATLDPHQKLKVVSSNGTAPAAIIKVAPRAVCLIEL
jgi:beta-galactosidase